MLRSLLFVEARNVGFVEALIVGDDEHAMLFFELLLLLPRLIVCSVLVNGRRW